MTQTKNQELLERCEAVTQLLRSLAHPARLKILCHLIDGEKTVNQLMEFCGTSQSAVSQFLGRMRLENLVDGRRDGSHVYYRIKDPKVLHMMSALQAIYCNETKVTQPIHPQATQRRNT